MASPLEIHIALHYWARNERYAWREPDHANSEAVKRIKTEFEARGLLRRLFVMAGDQEAPDYEPVRDALAPYVEALCAIPFPIQVWVVKNPGEAK